jgi:hypothetical protein
MSNSNLKTNQNEFGRLLVQHLDGLGPKAKNYFVLADVLPLSERVIKTEITAYSNGDVYGKSLHTKNDDKARTDHGHSITYDQSRQRRSLILYALGVKEDSDLIRKLREIDPNTEYPPQERPRQITVQDVKNQMTVYQKIKALPLKDKIQVSELVNRLYAKNIENKK